VAQPLQIVVIEGTTRVKRESIHAARLVEAVGKDFDGIEVTFVDPGDFDLPGDGNDPEGKDPKYTAITAKADGFFIVTPEYNHSFPGSLKRLLDSEHIGVETTLQVVRDGARREAVVRPVELSRAG